MDDKEELKILTEGLKRIVTWPPENYPRRSPEGYPTEICYDQYAYERMIDSYRDFIKDILSKAGEG